MYSFLHAEPVVDRNALRSQAREVIEGLPLIGAAATGQLGAVRALLVGFWPYVEGFEKAIDRQVARLPIKPLVHRFGRERIREFFGEARLSVREMKDEEGSHAELWRQSAEQLDIALGDEEPVGAVQDLLDNAWTDDPTQFFCWLAGTEYIAEELAAFLCASPAFLACFPSRRWVWGEAHIMVHDGPSHLEIDEDLAQAYHPSRDPIAVGQDLSDEIGRCLQLFWAAGQDVFQSLIPATAIVAGSASFRDHLAARL